MVAALKLVQVKVPSHQVAGENVELLCDYDLEGDTLYSVKWYRGEQEFFRYVPDNIPIMDTFPWSGISVDVSRRKFISQKLL